MTVSTKESPVRVLRLPKISREGISRGLSEIERPDLSKVELPAIEMPDIDMSKVDLPRVDVGKAVAGAAVALGIARPARSRRPFFVGAAVIAGLTAWALMRSTAVRERLADATRMARQRIDEMRAARDDADSVAFTSAEPMPIEPGAYGEVADALDAARSTSDYPEGFGAPAGTMAGVEDSARSSAKVDSRA